MLLLSRVKSVQRRCCSEFEIKQRHLVIKKRLIKTGERVASCANRIQQIKRRAFTGLQSDLRLILNVVHFRSHAPSIEVNPMLLLLERNHGLVYVTHHLIGKELLLVLRLLLLNESFGTFALITIRYGELNANAKGVAARAGRNLLDAAAQREIGNALSVLQADIRIGGTFA